MNGILEKKAEGWFIKWSDLHSFAHGTHWMWTPLHPDDIVDETKLKDGDKVECEFIYDNDNFMHIKYAKISKIAWKLFRVLKSGEITSLFINKTERLEYNKWLEAKEYPTKGYAFRPHWHCTDLPVAPHLTEKGRVWKQIIMEDFEEFSRPEHQGGLWYLANKIKIL